LPAPDRDAALKRLRYTTVTAELKGCDIVLEAVTEDLDLKNALWKELDGLCPPATIFASNTSSLTIAAMAAATRRADRFVGLHFFNPVPLMPLVEVVRTVTTSEETFRRGFAFAKSLGKEPVAAKDNSGFIVNLLLVPYLLDAIRAVEHGVASVPDIDKAMQLGCGYPMGPLTLLDLVGLDTTYRIAEIMFTEYREQRYAPPPLLKHMVIAGLNGRKSGKGFYDYSVDPPKLVAWGIGRAVALHHPPQDWHVRLRLAPLSRGGKRPPCGLTARDGAVRCRRVAHETLLPRGRRALDAVDRRDRGLDGRGRRTRGRGHHRARRGDSRAHGDARDARAGDDGHLHRRACLAADPPCSVGRRGADGRAPAQRRGARRHRVDGEGRRKARVRPRSGNPGGDDAGRDARPRGSTPASPRRGGRGRTRACGLAGRLHASARPRYAGAQTLMRNAECGTRN